MRGTGAVTNNVLDLIRNIPLLDPIHTAEVLNAPTRGDCGPGMVMAILHLVCAMYPVEFDHNRVPRYPSDVRARLAWLLVRDLHLSAEGQPDDDWQTLFNCGPFDQQDVGGLPPDIVRPYENESPYNHRTRIAEYVAYGELSHRRPSSQGVFWFTTRIIERLLRHYIEDMFVPCPGKDIEGWLHNAHADIAHVAIGPICIACLDKQYDTKILSPETAEMYSNCFQIIGIATGDHFTTYLNRAYVSIEGMRPSVRPERGPNYTRYFPIGTMLTWCSSIFANGVGSVNDVRRDDNAQMLIRRARGSANEPYPYTLSDMSANFPTIHDFPLWDTRLHSYQESDNETSDGAVLLFPVFGETLLPKHIYWSKSIYWPYAEDIYQHEAGLLRLYGAFVNKQRKFCRALYEIESFDIVRQKWMFLLVASNDPTFPTEVYLHPRTRVVAIRCAKVSSCPNPKVPLFDNDIPPEVQSFWEDTAAKIPQGRARNHPIIQEADVRFRRFNGFHQPVITGWHLATTAEVTPSTKPGLFIMAQGEPTEIPRFTTILEGAIFREAPSQDHSEFTRNTVSQIITRSDIRYVRRRDYQSLPFSIPYGRYSDYARYPNCAWRLNDGSTDKYSLELLHPVRASVELFLEPVWFDSEPQSIPLPIRQELFTLWRDEMQAVTSNKMRSHIMQLAEGIPFRVREFAEYYNANPDPTVVLSLSKSTPQPGTLDIRDRRRAREARRRTRKAVADVLTQVQAGTDEESTGWAAIRQIAEFLSEGKIAHDNDFKKRLDDIRREFATEREFHDDSAEIQRMLTSDPPELEQLQDHSWLADEMIYRRPGGGLEELYKARVQKLSFRGLPENELLEWLTRRAYPYAHRIVDLMKHGQETCMTESFQPNGGNHGKRRIVNNPAYHAARHVIEDNYVKLWRQRRAIIIREPMMTPADLARLHLHTIFAVPNPGKLCRIVVHMSKGTRSSPSYNESVDMERHKRLYPRDPLPKLSTYADWLHKFKEKFPNAGFLHAAVVDAKSAFQQFPLSSEKFQLVWMRLQVKRGAEWIHLLVGHVVGTFGDIGAGDTWGLVAACLQHIHNLVSELWSSLTYVDDMAIIAAPVPFDQQPARRVFYQAPNTATPPMYAEDTQRYKMIPEVHYAIHEAVIEARDNLAILFGKESSEDRKTKIFVACLEAVGWHFDLRYHIWRVVPLPKKIEKIAHYLFNVVSDTVTETTVHTMQVVTGLLCWFSVALPLGKSFVYPLFRCRHDTQGRVFINTIAARDLAFWRALTRVALVYPYILGCPIDLLRTTRSPDWFIVSDACTSTGGGAWLSRQPVWLPGNENMWIIMRWTPAEVAAIAARLLCYRTPTDEEWQEVEPSLAHFEIQEEVKTPRIARAVTINVLEFTQAVYTILVHAPILRGCVVDFGVDNTATMCWLVRNRSSPGAADTLLKLLSLTCTIYKIKLVVHHVRGVVNVLSDWMSRVLGAEFADP